MPPRKNLQRRGTRSLCLVSKVQRKHIRRLTISQFQRLDDCELCVDSQQQEEGGDYGTEDGDDDEPRLIRVRSCQSGVGSRWNSRWFPGWQAEQDVGRIHPNRWDPKSWGRVCRHGSMQAAGTRVLKRSAHAALVGRRSRMTDKRA